jgi:DNA-binding transcriptional LysR family regulator
MRRSFARSICSWSVEHPARRSRWLETTESGILCRVDAPVDLNHLRVFVAVHTTGSFAAAAEKLCVTRSTVSRSIAALEAAVGARLFHRTTRKVSTSSAGLALYDSVGRSIGALESSLARLPVESAAVTGTLRVTTTTDLGVALLGEVTARYLARYPGTRVEANLCNEVLDLVREGLDLAIRISRDRLVGGSLVAQRVGSFSLRLYASPIYLARRRAPRAPEELREHEYVGLPPARYGLTQVESRVHSNDFFFYRELLRAGAGIGLLPPFLASSDVLSGVLTPLLPQWTSPAESVYVVQPSRENQPRKVAAFRELLVETLRQRPLGVRREVSRPSQPARATRGASKLSALRARS